MPDTLSEIFKCLPLHYCMSHVQNRIMHVGISCHAFGVSPKLQVLATNFNCFWETDRIAFLPNSFSFKFLLSIDNVFHCKNAHFHLQWSQWVESTYSILFTFKQCCMYYRRCLEASYHFDVTWRRYKALRTSNICSTKHQLMEYGIQKAQVLQYRSACLHVLQYNILSWIAVVWYNTSFFLTVNETGRKRCLHWWLNQLY